MTEQEVYTRKKQTREPRTAPGPVKPMDLLFQGSDGHTLARLRKLINLHFRDEHSIHFYTSTLNTSLSTLNRLTKRMTGKSAYDLLQDRLHQEAITLLLYTSLSFKQISNQLGICDPAYFSRCFKMRSGHCPREFRRMNGID